MAVVVQYNKLPLFIYVALFLSSVWTHWKYEKTQLKKRCSPADESRLRPHSCSRLSVHLSCRGLDPSKWMPGHPCGPAACSYTNLGFLGKLLIQACSGRLTLESRRVVLGSRTLSLMPLEDNLPDGDLLQRDPPHPTHPQPVLQALLPL